MTSAIKEISIEGKDTGYFLFSKVVDEKNLSIYIINPKCSEAYLGSADESDLRCMAAEVRLPFSEFFKDTLSAISLDNPQNLQFVYTLEAADDSYQFKWKKVLDSGSIKIKLGCVTVQRNDFVNTLPNFLSQASMALQATNTKLKDVTDTLHKTEKEKGELESVLEEAVRVKENLEKEMYTKFLIILNSKKRKIRELYESLESASRKKPAVNNKKNPSVAKPSETKSNVDSMCKAGPSKAPRKNHDELFSSSDEEIAVLPAAKVNHPRRRRGEARAKLPRVELDCDKTVIYNENHSDESVDGLLDDL